MGTHRRPGDDAGRAGGSGIVTVAIDDPFDESLESFA